MRVSIAVPSFNYGRYIGHCLQSLAAQEKVDLEVLVADGGSKDDSLQVIRDWCARDPRFRLVSTEDKGQADAVRLALAQSSGEVLGYLNADDFLLRNDALASAVAAFRARPELGVVSFGGSYADEAGRRTRPIRLRYHPLDSLEGMKYRTSVLQPATFWRRAVHEAVPLRTEFHYVFDAVFFYEAYQRFPWQEIDLEVAGYRLHGANKSLDVRSARIAELARFEQIKFGERSARAAYLRGVAAAVRAGERLPAAGGVLRRAIYLAVNSLAFATAYRVPGI
jgi:glycosyltransferase involved in cell wall biosynthesis